MESALKFWEKAAAEGHIYAHVELSKHYEHRVKDPKMVPRWAKSAHKLAQAPGMPPYERKHWEQDLTKRFERLESKTGGKRKKNILEIIVN